MNTVEREKTEGVDLLRGNPIIALKKLSIPLIVSMMIISLYNIIDSFWIAGLGASQLTAVGFVIPLEFLIISVGTSLGAGITSVVSKYIGEENDELADNASVHSILISILVSLIVTVIFTVFMRDLLVIMGGRGISLEYAIQYAHVYFLSSIIVIMPNALYGLLRSEGDTKRTMYVMVLCAVLNMVLDPIFIYSFNLKMYGAALSTVLSLLIVLIIILYWIFIKRDTYLKPKLSSFDYDFGIIFDILKVAVPSICEMIFLTFITAVMHFIILEVASTDSVAVFENGWRMITLASEPMMAISTALISVVAANYGARNFVNIERAYYYGIKLSTGIGVVALLIFLVFAPQIAYLFSYGASIRLYYPTISFFHIFSWFFIVFPGGVIATYVFQGLGKGVYSLLFTVIREALCGTIFAILFGIVFNLGINGVWFGIMIGYTIGGLIAIVYGNYYIHKLNS